MQQFSKRSQATRPAKALKKRSACGVSSFHRRKRSSARASAANSSSAHPLPAAVPSAPELCRNAPNSKYSVANVSRPRPCGADAAGAGDSGTSATAAGAAAAAAPRRLIVRSMRRESASRAAIRYSLTSSPLLPGAFGRLAGRGAPRRPGGLLSVGMGRDDPDPGGEEGAPLISGSGFAHRSLSAPAFGPSGASTRYGSVAAPARSAAGSPSNVFAWRRVSRPGMLCRGSRLTRAALLFPALPRCTRWC